MSTLARRGFVLGLACLGGDYIVNALAHCFECHTPMGPEGPGMSKMGAGGFEIEIAAGKMPAVFLAMVPNGALASSCRFCAAVSPIRALSLPAPVRSW